VTILPGARDRDCDHADRDNDSRGYFDDGPAATPRQDLFESKTGDEYFAAYKR